MKLILETAYAENYGENGISYWKNKFGSTFVFENIEIEGGSVSNIDEILALINYSNSASSEEVINWYVISDDETLPLEEYELCFTNFYKKVDGSWKGFNKRDPKKGADYLRDGITMMCTEWYAHPSQKRSDYEVCYIMDDGSVMKSDTELRKWFDTVYTKRVVPEHVGEYDLG